MSAVLFTKSSIVVLPIGLTPLFQFRVHQSSDTVSLTNLLLSTCFQIQQCMNNTLGVENPLTFNPSNLVVSDDVCGYVQSKDRICMLANTNISYNS